jgi:SAM-dependent methyltransferase
MNVISRHLGNLFFSLMLWPILRFQKVARSKPVRKFVEVFFGRVLASRYHKVIAIYGPLYGSALSEGLDRVQSNIDGPITRIVDCGTGTGFVTSVVFGRFPEARIVSIDAVPAMLDLARLRFGREGIKAELVLADTANIPLPDAWADLVVAQNTTPFFKEFARICRPGGVVLFADSSAQLIVTAAIEAAKRSNMFMDIHAGLSQSGFYVASTRS